MRYAAIWFFICAIALMAVLVLPDTHTDAQTTTLSNASVSVTLGPTETPSTILWGDPTCDRVIDASDVIDVLRRVSNTVKDLDPCGPIFKSLGQSTTTFSMDPASVMATPGESTGVLLVLSSDTSVATWQVQVRYDAAILTEMSCITYYGFCQVSSSDTVIFRQIIPQSLTGTITIGAVAFMPVGEAGLSTVLDVEVVEVLDEESQPVAAVASDGEVILAGSTASPSPSPAPTIRTTPRPTETLAPFWFRADIDCDTQITARDALFLVEYLAFGYARSAVSPPCPVVGTETPAT